MRVKCAPNFRQIQAEPYDRNTADRDSHGGRAGQCFIRRAFQGQASDIEIHAREILYLRGRLNELMAKHTGQSVEAIDRDTDRDNFMSADQSVEYGLVDKVLLNRGEV